MPRRALGGCSTATVRPARASCQRHFKSPATPQTRITSKHFHTPPSHLVRVVDQLRVAQCQLKNRRRQEDIGHNCLHHVNLASEGRSSGMSTSTRSTRMSSYDDRITSAENTPQLAAQKTMSRGVDACGRTSAALVIWREMSAGELLGEQTWCRWPTSFRAAAQWSRAPAGPRRWWSR